MGSRLGRSAFALGVALASATAFGIEARAAQTDIAISTTPPPAAPMILGPSIIGSTPGSAFLYTTAATGAAPLSFSATGLPSGLSISSTSGTISGTTPAAGSYPVTVTVSNASGSATRTFTLVAGSTAALTPPLAWNSYDSFGASVTESDVLAAAQAMRTQLQPFGWNTVVVDYLWFDPEDVTDANGRYLPSPTKFPSATGSLGFKPLADKVHGLGLSFGIHIMRGIPRKTVSANAPIANSTFTAAAAGNTSDASTWDSHMWGVNAGTAAGQAWYDSIFTQYAAWGIDFVKVDDMLNPYSSPPVYHQPEVDAIRSSINKTGRTMVLSLSPGPMQTSNAADLNDNANMWRMVNDFWDKNGLSTLPDVFTAAGNWQALSNLTAGHWPDADMLPLGYLGPRCPVHASGPTALTHNQQVAVMSLWSILPSPLVYGGNVPDLATDATGPWTIALLTNEEVLAINQDPSGTHAKRVAQQGTTEVWQRDLSGGAKAIALFNNGTQDAIVSVTFAQLGVTGTPKVRDVWHRADVTGMTTGISTSVPDQGALLYVVSPPASDDAGTGADGSASGSSATSNGGSTSPGATSSNGSSAGGSSEVTGGSGGSASSRGESSSSLASAVRANGTSGCSCTAAGATRAQAPGLFATLCGLAALSSRRRVQNSRIRKSAPARRCG